MRCIGCFVWTVKIVVFLGLCAVGGFADAAVFYVDVDSAAATPDGHAWATAYKDIQSAVDAASTTGGGEVWVAEGTYKATTNPVLTMKEGVSVYGGFLGLESSRDARDWSADLTIIDGELARTCVKGAGSAALDGFTIKSGSAEYDPGGGMYGHGGGMLGGTATNCVFSGNRADSGCGGGMRDGTATNCIFTGNWAGESSGGGMYGGTATSCTFTGNSAIYDGGGMSRGTAVNCAFTENSAKLGGGMSGGAAANCTFTGNSAMYDGGGGMAGGTATNCTFTENSAAQGGGMSYGTAKNCIIWGNSTDVVGTQVSYSCLSTSYGGVGNIVGNPRFVNPLGGDFRIRAASPCIDAGTSDGAPAYDRLGRARPTGAQVDIGAFEHCAEDDAAVVEPPAVLRVNAASTADNPDGLTWATAYPTIQAAVDHAGYETELWVAQGTYVAATGEQVVKLYPAMQVYGGFTGSESTREARSQDNALTIIDGQRERRCITANGTASVDGFTVRNGKSDYGAGMYCGAATNCAFANNSAGGASTYDMRGAGAGMYGGTATNCTFTKNSAASGGAMYGGVATNCAFTENSANAGNYGGGGGMASGMATNCTFAKNSARRGGGMLDSTATDCIFTENLSNDYGYGAGMYGGCATGCRFSKNSASWGGGLYSGMATNCVFMGNSAGEGGGTYGGNTINCIFTGNSASIGGGSHVSTATNCVFTANVGAYGAGMNYGTASNCILWNNVPTDVRETTVNYSCLSEPYPGTGNTVGDPGFVDFRGGDFRLRTDSRCIDAGTQDGAPPTDIDGTTRPQGTAVDMGAYEYHGFLVHVDPCFFRGATLLLEDKDPEREYVFSLSLSRAGNDVPVLDIEDRPLSEQYVLDTTAYDDGKYALRLEARELRNGNSASYSQLLTVYIVNHADVSIHSGTITSDETWSADVVHVVCGRLTIAAGSHVVIEPGAVVKFDDDGSIYTMDGGSLTANGTSDSLITLTALPDDSVSGDTNMDGQLSLPIQGCWGWLTGTGTILLNDYVELRYIPATHSGLVDSSQVWRGQKIHHITGDVTIPAGATLTIMPGAIIKFDPGTALSVEPGGTLIANGNLAAPIMFTSIRDDAYGGDSNKDSAATVPGYGDWLGLRISGAATLAHCTVTYTGTTASGQWDQTGAGIYFGGSAPVTMDACTVAHCTFEGIGSNQSDLAIRNCIVYDCDRGISGYSGSLIINNCVVESTRWGLNLHGARVNLNNSSITSFTECGILVSYSAVTMGHCNIWNPANYSGISYWQIPDQTGVNGTLSVDPLYYDAGNGDYHLRPGSLLIDAADGHVAPETDYAGVPRVDDAHMPNTGTPTSTGAYADIGAFEVADNVESDMDLAVRWVRGPVSAQVGDTITVTYEVVNLGTKAVSGSWRDAIFLKSEEAALGAREVALGETTQTTTLTPGGSREFSATVTVPATQPGSWYFGVRANCHRDVFEGIYTTNNELLSTATLTVSMPSLTLDTAQSGRLGGDGSASFHLTQAAHTPLTLLFAGNDNVVLYVAFGRVPSASGYDLIAKPGQPVVLPAGASDRDVYVVVANPGSGDANYSVTPMAYVFRLFNIGANQGSDLSLSVVPLIGAGFAAGMTAVLEPADGGAEIHATQVTVSSETEAQATFDLRGKPAGNYNVTVQLNDETSTLSSAYTILHNAAPRLEARIIAPESIRAGRQYTLYVEYGNDGDVAMAAPLFIVSSANQDILMKLNVVDAYTPSCVQFLGLGKNNPVSLLQPGETRRVPIYFKTPTNLTGKASFALESLVDDNAVVDWNSMKASLRPPDMTSAAWSIVWSTLTSGTGTTWAEYRAALAADADALAYGGEADVKSVEELLAFRMMKIEGFGYPYVLAQATDAIRNGRGLSLVFSRVARADLDSRLTAGALGYGWTHSYAIWIEKASDERVCVHEPLGQARWFYAYEGVWKGGLGEYGALTSSNSGYVLREQNGIQLAFNTSGQLTSIGDPNGNSVSLTYSGDKLIHVAHSDGIFFDFTYSGDYIQKIADDQGHVTTYIYSGDYLTQVQWFDGRTTTYAYKSETGYSVVHGLTHVTYPDGTQRSIEYDSEGRVAAMDESSSGGGRTIYCYGADGSVLVTDPLGHTAQLKFGSKGALTHATEPLGQEHAYNRDCTGAVTSYTRPDGIASTLAYSKTGDIIGGTDAAGHTIESGYEQVFGGLAWIRDPRGNEIYYEYDSAGNNTAIHYMDGTAESFTYDSAGDIASRTNRRGQTVVYQYDSEGHITQKQWPDGRVFAYAYDARGNMIAATDSETGAIAMQYDAKDRLARIEYPGGYWFTFGYDNAGRRISRTDQTGFALHYGYEKSGRLATVSDAAGSMFVQYQYDAKGRLTREDKGNGSRTVYAYNAVNELIEIDNYAPDGQSQSQFHYGYDALGNVISMTTLDGTTTYTYDATGQLTGVTCPDGSIETYSYDAAGNRLSVRRNDNEVEYAANGMNHYTTVGDSTYKYDTDGDMTQMTTSSETITFTYDTQNRLIGETRSGGYTAHYTYDALGNRFKIEKNGETSYCINDPVGLTYLAGEYDASGNPLRRHIFGNGLVASLDTDNSASYYNFDLTGNVRAVTNAGGTVHLTKDYSPFGIKYSSTTDTVTDMFGFSGRYGCLDDGDGRVFMRTRTCDTKLGRFIQEDPIGLDGGDVNFCVYSGNDPITIIDPSGLAHVVKWTLFAENVPQWVTAALTHSFTADYFNKEFVHEHIIFDDESNIGYGPDGLFSKDKIPNSAIETGFNFPDDVATEALENLRARGRTKKRNYWKFGYEWQNCQDFVQDWAEECEKIQQERKCHSADTSTKQSCDPNEMSGPLGFGDSDAERYVTPGEELHYTVYFENKSSATASAQEIRITNPLSNALDWSTFRLGEVMVSNQIVTGLEGLASGSVEVAQDNSTLRLRVEAGINTSTGTISWYLRTVDPSTSDGWPSDSYAGLLPPNNANHDGEGYVTYSVKVRSDASTNAVYAGSTDAGRIDNSATITFDYNAPIVTVPAWWNRIASYPPVKASAPGIADGGTVGNSRPTLTWSNSGLAQSYNVYLWKNGDVAQNSPIASGITSTFFQLSNALDDGTSYSWRVDAVNANGTTAGQTWSFTYTAPNNAPSLDAIGDKTIEEGKTLTFTVSATDVDGDGLIYGADNLPQGASFDPTTHTFSWTPGYSAAGVYGGVMFDVSDNDPSEPMSDSETITITVTEGIPPATSITVPSIVGMTQANAIAALTQVGLVVGVITRQTNGSISLGQVAAQTPKAGANLFPGSAVDITVSRGSAVGLAGDVDNSGYVDIMDVQLVINGALRVPVSCNTDIDHSGFTDTMDVQLTINAALALKIDADNDGLCDSTEIRLGTSPTNPDTDCDGFSDGEEVLNRADPLVHNKRGG